MSAAGVSVARVTSHASLLADWDLLLLLGLILADVRVFQGSTVASFTLYELYAWGYCAPFVIGHLLRSRRLFSPIRARFVASLAAYLAWVLLASLFALIARGSSEVLQQAKNILPALPLVCFLFIRVNRPGTVARLANFYVLYCLAACALALWQFRYGGPYVRPEVENNEYKLDFSGTVVGQVVLGFSATPNELAVAVLPGVMFSAITLSHEMWPALRPRLTTLLCFAMTGTALLLAQSRGAVVWFLVGLAFMVASTRRNRSILLKFTLVGAVIGALVAFGTATPDDNVEVRFLLWKTSFAAMAADPYVAMLGDGMRFVKDRSWQMAGWEFPDAHNGWIDQALFFGAPAPLLYLGIWWRFFGTTDTAAASGAVPPRGRVMLDGIRASVLAHMGLYFFEPVAHAVLPVSQLFLLMSCGVCLANMPHGAGGAAP